MNRKGTPWQGLALLLLLLLGSCARSPHQCQEATRRKIEIDLGRIDDQGLRGPANGKVAVAYEFVIPDREAFRDQVTAIDPTIQFMSGSRGRLAASEGQVLCIGSTYQPNYRQVLNALANLPYVDRIVECYFE